MKKSLTQTKKELYYYKDGVKIIYKDGNVTGLYGDVTGLSGCVTGLSGEVNGIARFN